MVNNRGISAKSVLQDPGKSFALAAIVTYEDQVRHGRSSTGHAKLQVLCLCVVLKAALHPVHALFGKSCMLVPICQQGKQLLVYKRLASV